MPTQKTTLLVDDLCCADDERRISSRLRSVIGVERVTCDLVMKKVVVHHSCPQQDVTGTVRDLGFVPRLHHDYKEPASTREKYGTLIITCASGSLLLLGGAMHLAGIAESVTASVYIISILLGGWQIGPKAFNAARRLSMDMNVLMAVAAIGAAGIGKFGEGAAVVVLFSLSNLLERYSADRARKGIRSVMEFSPARATVVRSGKEVTEEVEYVGVGERIVIHPGERIPLDGFVTSGSSTVNQAPITGESQPVQKSLNDTVYAGSLNERGTLEVETTRPHSDTTLARIMHKIEEAQSERAPIQSIGDRFAKHYTPAVIALAVLIAVAPPILLHQDFTMWLYRALVLLVIACPCALVISTPLSVISGLTNAARHGVLIKGGRYLEAMGKIRAVAFDKTGTLTVGLPSVTDVVPLDSLTPERIIQLAAMLESKSEHPIAGAVLRRAFEQRLPYDNVTFQHFESITGRGVTAIIEGKRYFIGNHAFVEENRLCSGKVEDIILKLEREGKTVVIVTTEHAPIGVIAIADDLRSESKRVVRDLKEEGVEHVILMTGDNHQTAQTIAGLVGIDEVYSNLLPEDKMNRIGELKERYGGIAMVGDGINDAPALAASTVGMAMGATGTDAALETADIALMSDDLTKLAYLMRLSKKTLSIIRQNMAVALLAKLAFIVMGTFGIASLWLALLADDGVTLVVILNGLRLLRYGK
ncbi:MAG TPA: heavy metal translocating P-type ATPase [Bacteroidota bacterium]|jgi:Cd2+/Zn2+-exporting ATPase|nr:heavy metal translocating P-type ATPase [Bacteroidota bacterium]